MNQKHINSTLSGAICLLLGWGVATMLHECCHLATAHSLGYEASLGVLSFSTGSVFVYGEMPPHELALIAIAGSLGLIAIGVALILLSAYPAARMIGIVFLCRAWIDALPICDTDGAMMVEGTGWVIAWLLAIAEILVCGGMIWYALNDRPDAHRSTEVV